MAKSKIADGKRLMSVADVKLYGTRFCGYCSAAKNLLSEKGVEYTEIAVDNNPELRREVMELSGRRTVPQIWVNQTHVGGFDELRRMDLSGQLDTLLQSGT